MPIACATERAPFAVKNSKITCPLRTFVSLVAVDGQTPLCVYRRYGTTLRRNYCGSNHWVIFGVRRNTPNQSTMGEYRALLDYEDGLLGVDTSHALPLARRCGYDVLLVVQRQSQPALRLPNGETLEAEWESVPFEVRASCTYDEEEMRRAWHEIVPFHEPGGEASFVRNLQPGDWEREFLTQYALCNPGWYRGHYRERWTLADLQEAVTKAMTLNDDDLPASESPAESGAVLA